MILNVNDSGFKDLVVDSKVPVVVDCWAAWCGPCRMLAPILEKLQEEFNGKINIVKIDIDNNQEIADQYQIMSIPTMLLFKNGNNVGRIIGVKSQDALRKEFQDILLNA